MCAHCCVLRQACLVQSPARPKPKAGHSSLNFGLILEAGVFALRDQPESPALRWGLSWGSQVGHRCCQQGSPKKGSVVALHPAFVGNQGRRVGTPGTGCWLGIFPLIYPGTFPLDGCCTLPLGCPPRSPAPPSASPPPED